MDKNKKGFFQKIKDLFVRNKINDDEFSAQPKDRLIFGLFSFKKNIKKCIFMLDFKVNFNVNIWLGEQKYGLHNKASVRYDRAQ